VSAIDFQTRAIRARRATARIDPWFAALVAAMLVVFAAFFAIGRVTVDRQVEAPSGLQAASSSAASAIRLSSVPPIAIPAISKPLSVARPRAASASQAKVPVPDALTPGISRADPLAAPVREPQQAVSPEAKSVAPPPAGKRSSPAGKVRRAEPSNGGGSFDSSG
jgi:hypothetical protein